MSLSIRDALLDKRGCYVILPNCPFWRLEPSDNTADSDESVEVLEGPEVEVVDSCEQHGGDDRVVDVNVLATKSNDKCAENNNRYTSQHFRGTHLHQKKMKTEPDNKYYEVEAILDGPKKRREHLFKVCYKVRWKGYGPEADTWQPIADLANVQDMIEDFKKEKAVEKTEKEKQKSMRRGTKSDSRVRVESLVCPTSPEADSPADGNQYDPIYGTVKDKFWKDLELGRHQNYTQLFSGDMYSRIKGCRRAANAEVEGKDEEEHEQQVNRSSHSSRQSTTRSPQLLKDDYPHKRRSLSPSSSYHKKSSPGSEFLKLSPSSRSRKRYSDPCKVKDVSAKRSRRSRSGSQSCEPQEEKQPIISTVTSETVGIVTTSMLVTPPAKSDVSTSQLLTTPTMSSSKISKSDSSICVFSRSKSSAGESSGSEDDDSVCSEKCGRMTVSSETMLTVTTESKRLDMETETDRCFQVQSCGSNVGASGSEVLPRLACDESGATSSDSVPGHSEKTLLLRLSLLDAKLEAGGAVERTFDAECLWNGACNRSDCKSNRRRNMKNGHKRSGGLASTNNDQVVEGEVDHGMDSATEEVDNQFTSEEGTGMCCDEEHKNQETLFECEKDLSGTSDSPRTGLFLGASSSSKTSSPSRPLSSKSKRSVTHSDSSKKSTSIISQSDSAAQMKRSLFASPRADGSDSSFDDGSSSGTSLSRDAVSDSFHRIGSQAQALQMDSIAGSSTSRNTGHGLSALHGYTGDSYTQDSMGGRRSSADTTERPGLFSGNNGAFMFMMQNSGEYNPAATEPKHQQYTSPASSAVSGSHGKENSGRSTSKTSGVTAPGSYGRLQTTTGSTTSSSSPISQSRPHPEPSEGRSARKRGNDTYQPLEKIPSPNSRDLDLDQRIMTLTCDELEDFVEQGQERQTQKDAAFVSNADLLQAVNLSKADVVKRAIQQFLSTKHKLDFEQPDSTGLTLLMRAVQKGVVAIVEMLLEQGVDVNAQQTNGTSALMIAAEQNVTCLVALLLKYGANSSLYTVHSDLAETALMKAIKRQNSEVVSLMLRVGVNIAPPTCTSLSALEMAVERRNPHIEGIVRLHCQRLEQAFRSRVIATLEGTANLLEPLFTMQCFPLRESSQFVVKFNSNIHPVAPGEGFLLFIAHTKITEKGVKCRFHGGCPISSVTLNGVAQSPLTKEVNFVTSCHPIIPGCNNLVIHKLHDYTSKAKLVVQAFRARLMPC